MAYDVKLSKREQIIFNMLKRDRIATLERIREAVSKEEEEEVPRGTVNNAVKNLMTKVPHLGYLITRTTGLGRGVKATYRMSRIRLL